MKVAFDTNVILDFILHRPNAQAALELVRKVAAEEIGGIISANSITDNYYIARKTIGDEKAREAVADLLALFDVAPVDGDGCSKALATPMKDYEDAVLAVCSAQEGADYLVTRDEDFLAAEGCPVQVVSPGTLLEMLN